MLSKTLLTAAALALASAGLAKADHMQNIFTGGHEPTRQFQTQMTIDKEAPYALTGYDRDGRAYYDRDGRVTYDGDRVVYQTWPREREIRVGSRIVGFMRVNEPGTTPR